MNPDDITRILDELGNRLGPAGQRAFELAVRYKVTDAIVGGLFGLALVSLSVFGARWVYKHEFNDPMDRDMAVLIGFLLAGIGALIGSVMVFLDLVTLLNPEYSALRDIIGALR